MIQFILWLVVALLVVVAIRSFKNKDRTAGLVTLLAALMLSSVTFLAFAWDIDLPQLSLRSWSPWVFALGCALIVTGAFVLRSNISIIGAAIALVGFFNMFVPTGWSFWLGLLAGLLACSIVFFVRSSGRSTSFIAKLVIGSLFFASFAVAIAPVKHVYDEAAIQRALNVQLDDNNRQNTNQTFTSLEDVSKKSAPGSADKVLADSLIATNKQVDKNTKAITTLTGQVAKVTEKVDKAGVVIKSAGGTTDKQATESLAKQLAAAGWGPEDIRINNVDEARHIEHGTNYRFADRLRTKAAMVKFINSDTPAAKAARAEVLKDLPADQHARFLSGEGVYAIQLMDESVQSGNAYRKNGETAYLDRVERKSGDVLWVYVGNDGEVHWNSTVRDDCANPRLETAPAPKKSKQARVCPENTDRAGKMIGSGCNNPAPNKPKHEKPGNTPNSPTPSTTEPGKTPTPTPSTSTPTGPTTSVPPTTSTTTPTPTPTEPTPTAPASKIPSHDGGVLPEMDTTRGPGATTTPSSKPSTYHTPELPAKPKPTAAPTITAEPTSPSGTHSPLPTVDSTSQPPYNGHVVVP